jgi:hypothetical protein
MVKIGDRIDWEVEAGQTGPEAIHSPAKIAALFQNSFSKLDKC